ncbi:unnamed protein product, partial [Laminaria digitata]
SCILSATGGGAGCWVGAALVVACGIFVKLFAFFSLRSKAGRALGLLLYLVPGMSLDRNDLRLLQGVVEGKLDAVTAAVEAGANVNGPPRENIPPIARATVLDHVDIVDFLLEQGADPDNPSSASITARSPGGRTLHFAASTGKAEIVRLLLKRSDVNATDNAGYTPLMATCQSDHAHVEVVRLLLDAGADPTLAGKDGRNPLHLAARSDHMDLVDMLHSKAPATLNRCDAEDLTPLYMACHRGHESMVSKLLSLGAMHRMSRDDSLACPLAIAVAKGFVGVVRALITERGMRAVGGEVALVHALIMAVCFRQARLLPLLLTVGGEESRSTWANAGSEDEVLLKFGASHCYPAAVSILLEAGADETERDSEGRTPLDVIGVDLRREGVQMDRGKEVAVRRMLQRGPAYRARSWAWPSDDE